MKWAQRDRTQCRELSGLFMCVCTALCTIVAHNTAQNRPDNFLSYSPDNQHCSDDVYLKEGGPHTLTARSRESHVMTAAERQHRTPSLTRDILDGGNVLNVLRRLARTPGGGSNTKTRPARSRLTGSCSTVHINTSQMTDRLTISQTQPLNYIMNYITTTIT